MAGIHFVGPDEHFLLVSFLLSNRKEACAGKPCGAWASFTLSDVLLKVKAQQNTVPEIL